MAAARQDGLARREALLDAALVCFQKKGMLHTGIEDIRKEAGASPSSVYHLFQDLPALVAALLQRTYERLIGHIAERVQAAKTPRAAVTSLVEAHLEWVFGHDSEARFMYQALACELDEGHRAALRAAKSRLKKPIYEHLARVGVFKRAEQAETMVDVVLLGPTHQACRQHYSSPGSMDSKWMRAHLPELAWRSVAGRA
jgi:AcrR family transcriptional regulator